MNVLTTPRRIYYFLELFDRVGLREPAYEWLKTWEKAPHSKYVVTMPADAWHLLAELLRDDVFGPRGFARPKTPAYKLSACQEIQQAVNIRRIHPGLKGRGAVGQFTEFLTGWQPITWGTVDRWAAFRRELEPFLSDRFVVLAPHHRDGFTIWKPSDASSLPGRYARLCEDHEHIVYCIEVQANR